MQTVGTKHAEERKQRHQDWESSVAVSKDDYRAKLLEREKNLEELRYMKSLVEKGTIRQDTLDAMCSQFHVSSSQLEKLQVRDFSSPASLAAAEAASAAGGADAEPAAAAAERIVPVAAVRLPFLVVGCAQASVIGSAASPFR